MLSSMIKSKRNVTLKIYKIFSLTMAKCGLISSESTSQTS